MNWRLRSDQPPDGAHVLVYPGWYGDAISIMQWSEQYQLFLLEHEDGVRVTHWMPLPEPPKVAE
jgi:hypothetical protein